MYTICVHLYATAIDRPRQTMKRTWEKNTRADPRSYKHEKQTETLRVKSKLQIECKMGEWETKITNTASLALVNEVF